MTQRAIWFAVLLSMFAPALATAEQVRYRYVPTDMVGTVSQVPIGPEGTIGELKRGLGVRTLPYPYAVKPNQMVTFRHPYNGRNVTVPLRLPADPAQMEHQRDRIIYNYGDYTVSVRFLTDGAVDVVYNSGLMRPLRFD
jgi:hypothetical protein